jgi:hypothetical protein
MKSKKYYSTLAGFMAGALLGLSVAGFLSFTSGPAAPGGEQGITPVTAVTANGYVRTYTTGALPLNKVLKGFTVDRLQLQAMNTIAAENTALTGYRIYLGKDAAGKPLTIVVGVDNLGKDAVKNSIFATDARQASPCPPVCDVSSPIGAE